MYLLKWVSFSSAYHKLSFLDFIKMTFTDYEQSDKFVKHNELHTGRENKSQNCFYV